MLTAQVSVHLIPLWTILLRLDCIVTKRQSNGFVANILTFLVLRSERLEVVVCVMRCHAHVGQEEHNYNNGVKRALSKLMHDEW